MTGGGVDVLSPFAPSGPDPSMYKCAPMEGNSMQKKLLDGGFWLSFVRGGSDSLLSD